MKDCKKPSGYIESLWLKGKLKQFTIDDILSYAESDGYTFARNSIRAALLSLDFIATPKKNQRHVIYSQKYPPAQSPITKVEESYVSVFNSLELHKDIRKASSKLFLDSHFDQAIFAAFKKVNNLVKKKSKQPSKDGKALMLSAFSRNNPIIKINNLVTESDMSEQEGLMNLFAGSMQGIRNPHGHDDEIDENPWNTIELLCFASLLAKKLEKSELNKNYKKPADKKLTR